MLELEHIIFHINLNVFEKQVDRNPSASLHSSRDNELLLDRDASGCLYFQRDVQPWRLLQLHLCRMQLYRIR